MNNIRVGLQNTWYDKSLNNHFVVTSYERDDKVLRELETLAPLSNDYKGNSNYSALNPNENNSTKEILTSQEPTLTILEKSQLEKQKKLESECIESEQEFLVSHQIFLKEAKGNATNFKLIRPKALKR
ncbi:DUF3519 domain-containing protein [Helicobacter pylori]|uniref:DUF3519 domain-containing protein n=1 Tax=Helicobacter pylori TaxID=210 RepID=UPI000174CAF2|nr:hypothetical protein HPSH_05730 [Helicobacter pylori Shi470]